MCVLYEWLGQKIAFAAPPKTASTFFQRAIEDIGAKQLAFKGVSKHKPDWPESADWYVTIRREAEPWLRSFYRNARGSCFGAYSIDMTHNLDWSSEEAFLADHKRRMDYQTAAMWDDFRPPSPGVVLHTERIADDTADFLGRVLKAYMRKYPPTNVTQGART